MTKAREVSAREARATLPDILDAAKRGRTTVVIRHAKPVAAIVPAAGLEMYNLVRHIMVQLGESIAVSTDRTIVAAVVRAQDEIAREKIFWDEIAE